MIPAWLQRRQSDAGTRAVALRVCPRCRAAVLFGLDADVCALTVRADPIPIDEKGEAVAAVTGRITFDLTGDGKKKQLDPRSRRHIEKPRRYLVFAEHQCGNPLTQFQVESPEKKKVPADAPIPF